MRIFVKAKPNAREDLVEKIDETHFIIHITEPPVRGRANFAIIKLLATYFNVPTYNIKIISGYTSREKIIGVLQ